MVNTMTSEYKFIENLSEDWQSLAASELPSLAESWFERRKQLVNSKSLKQFNDRLVREWAIEAGTLEKLYEIDRGITVTLIEKGLDASLIPFNKTNKSVELVARILNDHKEALEGVFAFVKSQRQLSTSYIKELHQALTRSQKTVEGIDQFGTKTEGELLRGQWKKLPNNPTRMDGEEHAYCPPIYVQDEMDKLVAWHNEHMKAHVPPEVEAAWLHHRFTQIHPFQDGNGRVARALASLVLLKAGWFPLVFLGDRRSEYLSALEEADKGNLKPLINLFGQVQKKAIQRALSIADDVMEDSEAGTRVQQIISAAGKALQGRHQANIQAMEKLAKTVEDAALKSFKDVAKPLNKELKALHQSYGVRTDRSSDSPKDWRYQKQVIKIAKKLEYFPDWRTYKAWVALKIKEEQQADIVLAIHGLGVRPTGIMAASAFLEYKGEAENGEDEGPYPLCSEPFQFSIKEDKEAILKRFKLWLNEVIVVGLDQWRRQL